METILKKDINIFKGRKKGNQTDKYFFANYSMKQDFKKYGINHTGNKKVERWF